MSVLLNSLIIFSTNASALEEKIPIVVDGDHVEYFNEERKIIATGNVRIEYVGAKLKADSVVVYSQTKDVVAEGNVRLETDKGILEGSKILYNFENKTGSIVGADVEAKPFYAQAPTMNKVSDRELVINRGYFTTCDLSDPHWRIIAKRVLIFPEDRVVAKNASIVIGNVPVITLPQYVHVLNDKRPRVAVEPGHDKDWGYYLLTAWRYYINEGFKGRIHVDYRERKDFAEGVDLAYKPPGMGAGLLRTYYMHERAIQSKHIWDKDRDTIERERFRVQWRHKWQIDPATGLLWQYNKMKDSQFLFDYFRREYEIDETPTTYAQFTNAKDIYAFNLLVEKRVNRFLSELERLPQAKFETTNFRLGDSHFYFKSNNDFSRLIQQNATGTALDDPTTRFDTFNRVTYPLKLSIFDFSPFAGLRETYYSEDLSDQSNQWRDIFYAGTDISTRFFRIYDVKAKFLGVEVNQLRHIVNPVINYSYIHQPSISSSDLNNFDEIDSINKQNTAHIALENKLQTKRLGQSIDLVSHILSSDYFFEGRPVGGHFSDMLKSQLEIRPREGFRIDVETDVDRIKGQLTANNTDFYYDNKDKYSIGLGHRYQKDINNQLTSELNYRFNPLWKIKVYERFELLGGGLKEQQYVLSRDLHCWLMEVSYHVDRGRGETIWFAFRLKAFPEMGFEFDNTYHQPKAGSQSY